MKEVGVSYSMVARIKLSKIKSNEFIKHNFLIIGYCLLTLGFFYLFRIYTHKVNLASPVISLVASTVYCLIFSGLRCQDTSKLLSIVTCFLSLVCVGYIFFSYPVFIPSTSEITTFTIEIYFYISIFAGITAIWRPVFALIPFVYIPVVKSTMYQYTGIAISETDYAVIVETGAFSVFGMSLFWLFGKIYEHFKIDFLKTLVQIDKKVIGDIVIYLLIAVHFSNYYYAGYAKLVLDGPIFSWLYNDTYNILYQSIVLKTMPFQHIPWMVSSVGWGLENFNFIGNVLVLLFQITAPLALLHRNTIIFYTVFYDLLHISIFIATGIFFWKWIFLNTILLFSIKNLHFRRPKFPIFVMAFILCLLAPKVFYIPKLGWYDSREGNLTYFEAILTDGKVIKLPTNYFRNYSITFAQHRVFKSAMRHKSIYCYGATHSWEQYKNSYDCKNSNTRLIRSDKLREKRLTKLDKFIKQYHHFTLLLSDQNNFHYNYFPHHIWSNPFMFKEDKLDISAIKAYRYVVEGYCIKNLKKGSFDINKSVLDSQMIFI